MISCVLRNCKIYYEYEYIQGKNHYKQSALFRRQESKHSICQEPLFYKTNNFTFEEILELRSNNKPDSELLQQQP